jgi:hypothetical protein
VGQKKRHFGLDRERKKGFGMAANKQRTKVEKTKRQSSFFLSLPVGEKRRE